MLSKDATGTVQVATKRTESPHRHHRLLTELELFIAWTNKGQYRSCNVHRPNFTSWLKPSMLDTAAFSYPCIIQTFLLLVLSFSVLPPLSLSLSLSVFFQCYIRCSLKAKLLALVIVSDLCYPFLAHIYTTYSSSFALQSLVVKHVLINTANYSSFLI